jgi:hypothetical protein
LAHYTALVPTRQHRPVARKKNKQSLIDIGSDFPHE